MPKKKKTSKKNEEKIHKNRVKSFNTRFPAGSKRTSSNLKDWRYSTGK